MRKFIGNKNRKRIGLFAALALSIVLLGSSLAAKPALAIGGTFKGTIYYTQYTGSVSKVSFDYDSVAHTVTYGSPVLLNGALPGGADGLVFDPQNGNLLIGSNNGANYVQEVDPSNPSVVTPITSGTSTPYHMMVDPSGTTAWTSGIPGEPASIPLTPLSSGTGHPLSGDDTSIDTIAWTDASHAFYTSSGAGGNGHFGTIDLNTFTTTCAKDNTGACETFPAAHGMTYDSFTKDIIIFGNDHITQIDPTTLTVVSDETVPGVQFDQGTVDGAGHLFVANNGGTLFFEDYSASGQVNAPVTTDNSFSAPNMDDVAPLVGLGSGNPATVTVIKHIIGGPAILDENVTLLLNGTKVENGTANTVTVGVQQNVSESYSPSSLSSQYTASFSGNCTSDGTIPASKVLAGANLKCEITDTFKFFVLPESPVGAAALMSSSLAALGAYFYWMKTRRKKDKKGSSE